MKDKTQKITTYISNAGLEIYEIQEYNKNCNEWFIVGDSSTNKKFIQIMIDLHNFKI